jgi:hypothetical protein
VDRSTAYLLYERSLEYLRGSAETTTVESAERTAAPAVEIAVVVQESEKEAWLGPPRPHLR